MKSGSFWTCATMLLLAAGSARAESTDRLLKMLAAVESEGRGNAQASAAWQELAKVDAAELPKLLLALNEARPLGANWIRAAIDAVVERRVNAGGDLPRAELEKFLHDKSHQPRARRLAYELLVKVDKTAPDRLVPGMLDDPSLELRRDAVARLLDAANKQAAAKDQQAADTYSKALTAARDMDQVRAATDALKKLGHTVDLTRHFGFVQEWKVIGPFDNTTNKGFAVAYPPESKLDAAADHPGKKEPVRWIDHRTSDEMGMVDLNKALGKHMGAAAYAWADFYSPAARPIELRVGSDCAVKFWLNGKLLSAANVYHANVEVDQYVGRGQLQKGRNQILVKICQNEQTEVWAQTWQFQLRVCDATGTAVHSQSPSAKTASATTTGASE